MLSPLLLALAACSSSSDDTAASAESYTPAPYIVDEEDPPQASFSADDVAAAIAEALAVAPTINAAPVFPAYAEVMEGQSNGCPDYYETNGNAYWYDYCTSDAGTTYEGYSFYYRYDGYDTGTETYDGDVLYGVARVTDGRGHVFEAGGQAGNLRATANDGSYVLYQSIVQGSFAYDGDATRGTWMEDGIAPDLVMYAYYAPAYDGRAFVIDGGLSDLGGSFSVVVFDSVTLFDAHIGGACPEEPGGLISVRDQEGNWYDVVLDGEVEYGAGVEPGTCDGCGTAWFKGEEVGQVCLDFTVLTSWGEAPW